MKTTVPETPTNQTKVESMNTASISLKEFDTYAHALIKLFGQYQDMKH